MDLEQVKLKLDYVGSRNTYGLTAEERAELDREYEQAKKDYLDALVADTVAFGSGMIELRNDGSVRHVPRSEWEKK